MRPMNLELLQKYWSMVEPKSEAPMIEWPDFMVVNGYCENHDSFNCFRSGTKHFETEVNHGIMRTEIAGGHVEEASYKHGKLHGLRRTINNRSVVVELFRDGEQISSFTFTNEFCMKER